MSATLPAEVVLDASAAVRGYFSREGLARDIVDGVVSGSTAAHVPGLFAPEVTSALRVRVDAQRWPLAEALHALAVLLDWPVAVRSCEPLAVAALEVSGELGISAYDAFYAVLSRELGIPLVTADRRLAAAVPGAVLVV